MQCSEARCSMSNLIEEINYLVEYFREIDRKFEQLKDSEEYFETSGDI